MQVFYQILTQTPVVLMHGSNNDLSSMDNIKKWLEQSIPDIHIRNCEVGNGKKDSLFMEMNEQIDLLRHCIVNDKLLQNGFFGLGYSLGGYLLRGYLEKYNEPKMKRLITLSSPHSGLFCGVQFKCFGHTLPGVLNSILPKLVYSDFVQNSIAEAAYWRDPYNFDMFIEKSGSLAALDNLQTFNETYKKNFLQLELLVLFGSKKDEIIWPWNSAWFGAFIDNDAKLHDMTERVEYQQDLFGLRSLNEAGKVQLIESGLSHKEYTNNEAFIKNEVVTWIQD